MEAVRMENTIKLIAVEDTASKIQQRLDMDKGKSLDELYHEAAEQRAYEHYKMIEEEREIWNS